MSLFSFGERKREAGDNKRTERPAFGGFMLPNSSTKQRNILDFIPDKPEKNLEVEATKPKPDSLEVSDFAHKELPKKPVQENRKKEKPNNFKSIDTVSGNYVLSRGWESSNMTVFRSKRKKK